MDDKKLIQEIESSTVSYMFTPSENMLDRRFSLDSFREITSPENVLRLVELAKKGCFLKWTKDKPTAPGFYWMRNEQAVSVVEVWKGPRGELVVLYPGDEVEKGFLEIPDAEWAGPIPEPRGVEDD